jgi:hypothetical protein
LGNGTNRPGSIDINTFRIERSSDVERVSQTRHGTEMSKNPAPSGGTEPGFSNDDLPASKPSARTLLLIAATIVGVFALLFLIVFIALVTAF